MLIDYFMGRRCNFNKDEYNMTNLYKIMPDIHLKEKLKILKYVLDKKKIYFTSGKTPVFIRSTDKLFSRKKGSCDTILSLIFDEIDIIFMGKDMNGENRFIRFLILNINELKKYFKESDLYYIYDFFRMYEEPINYNNYLISWKEYSENEIKNFLEGEEGCITEQ